MASRNPARFACLRNDQYLPDKLALTLVITGFTITLTGSGLLSQRKEHGEDTSSSNSSLLQVNIGTVIFLIGGIWFVVIWMNRKGYLRLCMGYPRYTMGDRLRTERSDDIELADMGGIAQQGVEQPARPSDASDRPLLPQRPEPAYLLPPRPRYSALGW
jgi:hypothetical protein